MTGGDVDDLRAFLTHVDLTTSGLDAPTIRLWVHRDADGAIVGSTGFELSENGFDVLIRSVATDPVLRGSGAGTSLAQFALDRARDDGARRAWLFSRRSGPFWQRLGFAPADREVLAARLAATHQVRLFRASGQLEREVAWDRSLTPR